MNSSLSQLLPGEELPIDMPQPGLATVEHPCIGELLQPEPLVLLHGWGSDSRIWQQLLPLLVNKLNVITVDLPGFGESEPVADNSLEHWLKLLEQALPERCSLLGWSLGGMLATAFTACYPQRINSLITLASNACFTRRKGWSTAMPEPVYNEFCDFFQQQPAQCLKRFHGLQAMGVSADESAGKQLLKTLRSEFNQPGDIQWQQALTLLGKIDNRENLQGISVPGLHIFGDSDALVPASAAATIRVLNNSQQIEVLANTGHVAQLSCPQKLADSVLNFLNHCRYHLDKQRVAESFSRAAASYDKVARLQRQVGRKLLDALPDISPRRILDLGCGTGYFTEFLAQKYPDAEIIGLDLAPGMVDYARSHRRSSAQQKTQWLCGDAECLPLADSSIDLIFSSLAFQWCEQLPQLAAEVNRVLSDQGVLAFTSLAEGTLNELKTAWATVDNYVHVNQFHPSELWKTSFAERGLAFTDFSTVTTVLDYSDLRQLTHELKGIGAHNVNNGQNRGMTGRQQMRMLLEAYERFRMENGALPATWQVIYGIAGKETVGRHCD